MRDRARDWGEQDRPRPRFLPILRAAVPLARSSLAITVDHKRKGLHAVFINDNDPNTAEMRFSVIRPPRFWGSSYCIKRLIQGHFW